MGYKPRLNLVTVLLTVFTVGCTTVSTRRDSHSEESTGRSLSSSARVLIYDGPGVCDGCAEDVARVVRRAGHTAVFAQPQDIRTEYLRRFDLYIQPGGDSTMTLQRALGPEGTTALRNYVSQGGRYMGICLGATFAATGSDNDGLQMLGLLPVSAFETGDMTPRVGRVNLDFGGFGTRQAFLQDPPEFTVLSGRSHRVRVLGRYPNGRAAVVAGEYQRGSVTLMGPHLEADDGWFIQNGLVDPDGHEQAVFQFLLRDILRPKALPIFQSAPPSDGGAGRGQR